MPPSVPNHPVMPGGPESTTPDDVLARRARRGEQEALEGLLDRHLASTWQLSCVVHPTQARARGATVRSVATTLSSPPTPTVQLLPVRFELLAAARADSAGEPSAPPVPDLLATDAAGRARAAFEALPEGWRTVLWLRLVEGIGARHAAPVLGLSVAGTEQLLDRARAGWHEGAVRQLTASTTAPDCRRTASRLGGYVEDSLSDRDRSRVRRHLDACASCRAGLEELDDLAPLLRRSAPSVPIDLRHAAVAAWLERTRAHRGPFGMILPGGHPMPAWAERTLAGAAAAVVALGIAAAVISSGRSGRPGGDVVVLHPFDPLGPPDGESALAEVPASPEGGNPGVAPADGTPAGGPSHPSGPDATGGVDESARALPRTATGAGPSPDAPPATAPPPSTPGPGTTPPATEAPGVSVRIDGDTGVSVGEDCTGVEVLGVVIGCEPPADAGHPLPGV